MRQGGKRGKEERKEERRKGGVGANIKGKDKRVFLSFHRDGRGQYQFHYVT